MAPGLLGVVAAVLAAVASLAAHVALNCPVQPVPSPPWPPTPPPNNLLQRLEKLGEGALDAPEDVYVDAAAGGALYTATRDGWLQRMHPSNGSWERWRFVGGTGLLGIAPSADGAMLVCDADKGLLRVGEEGVTILASEVEGTPIRFADAAIEASDGTVYFSDVSTRFGFDRWFYDYLESRATGRLLRYDPRNGETSVVLDRLSCANGVALPKDETFVVVCETGRFRCMKVWLRGEKAGEAETFVDNLPGAPDNIADEVAMAGLHHPLDLHEESGGFVPCVHRVEQGNDQGCHGGSGVGGRQHRPRARRLRREGDQLRHIGHGVQRGHLPRQPLHQLCGQIISGAGDTTGAGRSIILDDLSSPCQFTPE